MFLRAIAILLIASGLGCSSGVLHPDPVLVPSIAAGYPSLEFTACGQRWNGLGVCELQAGQPYNSVALKIQTYFSGELKVDSKKCAIDTSTTYQKSALIDVPIGGVATQDCIVTITMEPNYPIKEPNTVKTDNFRGSLAIKVLSKNQPWTAQIKKVTGIWSSQMDVPVINGELNTRVYAEGCGLTYDAKISPLSQLWIEFDLNKAVSLAGVNSCLLHGFVMQGSYVGRWNAFVAQYDPRFAILPSPALELDGTTLNVVADDAVTVISLDDSYQFSQKCKFKFDPTQPHVLRLFTVSGRLVVGEWSVTGRAWRWMP